MSFIKILISSLERKLKMSFLPLELKEKVLLDLPYDQISWVKNQSFWLKKVKKDFGVDLNKSISARKCKQHYRNSECAERLVKKLKNCPWVCDDDTEFQVIEEVKRNLDNLLSVVRLPGSSEETFNLLVEVIIEFPNHIPGYTDVDVQIAKKTITELTTIALVVDNDKKIERLILGIFNSGRYIVESSDPYEFHAMKELFKVKNKASWFMKLYIEDHWCEDAFISREQIPLESIDDEEEDHTWGSDNEDILRSLGALILLITWLKKNIPSFDEDIPGSDSMFPPYDSPELEKHLYWIVTHPRYASC